MNEEDKIKPDNWTPEERDRVVRVFEWLLKEDRKQNPNLYIAKNNNEKKTS